ncbi:MAG: phospholipase A [Ferruginibacter sp.]
MISKLVLLFYFTGISLLLYAQDIKGVKDSGFIKKSTTMTERWELDDEHHKGYFLVTPYKPVYVSAGRWSSSPNMQPTSENPAYTLPFKVAYNNYEAKFQFSLKTKIIRKLFWGHGDIWVAYTQKAHWQVYNKKLSRPFRELNYEPEVILNFPTKYKLFGFNGRMVGVSMNHQSNGRTLPLSRSWNRIVFHAGLETKEWQVMLRPWIRLHDEDDENPHIEDYVGRMETVVVYNMNKHQFSAVAAHSLKFTGRGSIQLNWVFPIVNNFRGQLQLFEGYGETLQDYNHRQTTLGICISLVDW